MKKKLALKPKKKLYPSTSTRDIFRHMKRAPTPASKQAFRVMLIERFESGDY